MKVKAKPARKGVLAGGNWIIDQVKLTAGQALIDIGIKNLKQGLPLQVDAYDDAELAEAGSLFEKLHNFVGNDLVIAATTRASGAILVTGNLKEFNRVPGLSCEDW